MRSPRIVTKSSSRSPQLEKACLQQRRPNVAKKHKKNQKKKTPGPPAVKARNPNHWTAREFLEINI